MALPNLRRHHPKERLAHLSPADREKALKHPILGDLVVIYGGYFPEAKGHCVDRPRGYDSHQIALVESGRGTMTCGRRTFTLEPGHLFLARGDGPVFYRTEDRDPWTLLWVHVTGRGVPTLLSALDFPSGFPVRMLSPRIRETCRRELLHALSMVEAGGAPAMVLSAAESLRRIFLTLTGESHTRDPRDFPVQALEVLGKDPRVSVPVPEWARRLGISPTGFRLKMKAATGESPLDFLTRQRMGVARDLLRFQGASVAEAAEAVGFDDPFHFSRRYRQVWGRSPRTDRGGV